MTNNVIITTELCTTIDNCRTVELKLSQSELAKLQTATTSSSEIINYSDYAEFFFISFSATLSLWLLAKVVGLMLGLLKRA
ncbi:hypothetical protein [Pasteurella multocida]|uniref:hypothetical protein n=1 Tax=Pasteurella multocida TaxID=747 RepID=UPI002FE3E363